MKSGLEGRNNPNILPRLRHEFNVSMKSGLEGRNNLDYVAPELSEQIESQ